MKRDYTCGEQTRIATISKNYYYDNRKNYCYMRVLLTIFNPFEIHYECTLRFPRNAEFTYESQHDDFEQEFCADALENDTLYKCARQLGLPVLIEVSRDAVKK